MSNLKSKTDTPKSIFEGMLFKRIKNEILGKKYELSATFVGEKKSAELNWKFRKKRGPTDILAFPLSTNSGELIFNKPELRKKARLWKKTESEYLSFLFIHGSLHLKGFIHGSKMKREERKFCTKFAVPDFS